MELTAVAEEAVWPEADVRQLRDNIYGACTDKNWEASRSFIYPNGRTGGWMAPDNIKWLLANQPKKK